MTPCRPGFRYKISLVTAISFDSCLCMLLILVYSIAPFHNLGTAADCYKTEIRVDMCQQLYC